MWGAEQLQVHLLFPFLTYHFNHQIAEPNCDFIERDSVMRSNSPAAIGNLYRTLD